MATRFLIKLQQPHKKSGMSVYAVAKKLGLAYNTVNKYVGFDDPVISDSLPHQVIQLAQFYGVDWKNPDVVEVIEVDEDEPEPEDVPVLV